MVEVRESPGWDLNLCKLYVLCEVLRKAPVWVKEGTSTQNISDLAAVQGLWRKMQD